MPIPKKKYIWIIGIDEAGRGPIAGPVAVGIAAIRADRKILLKQFPKILDSKQLSKQKREQLFEVMQSLSAKDFLFSVSLSSSKMIDSKGIVHAIKYAMEKSLHVLATKPSDAVVLLDGSLIAPSEYIHQKTIIKGDAKEQIIGLASIAAKVTRDRYMTRLAQKYPQYGFEKHKGYGTQEHYTALKKCGISEIHRKTFLKGFSL